MAWQNEDGLYIRYGTERGETKLAGATVQEVEKYLVVDLDYADLPAFTADLNNDGTNDGFSGDDPYVPAGSFITAAYIIPTTTFTSAGSTTLSLGMTQLDGTVIDADGIDATIAKAALAAGAAVACDGALVGGTVALTNDAYVYSTVATGPFTAGAGKLVIKYITT